MIKLFKENWIPIVSAVILYLALSFTYFSPVMQGKILQQHDKSVWQSSSKEVRDWKEKTGEQSLWTNSMFSGMPTYLINNLSEGNKLSYLHKLLHFNNSIRPVPFLFMYLLGFFLALMVFGVRPWLSMVGALAFAFSTYFFIIIEAGHITKAVAIGYMPPIVAGVYLAFKNRPLWGTILMSLFLSIQLVVNHLQITYYTFLIVLIFGIYQIVEAIQKQQLRFFFRSLSYLMVGAILAIGSNFLSISAVYEYGQESIRGKSELTHELDNKTSGLDKDYATDWSYGILESFNLMVPNLMGGASQSELSKDSETYQALRQLGQPNAKQIIKQMPTYWGSQPFTSGPTYIGALVLFLFALGLFVVKDKTKWWLLTATVLSLMLAWGKNMMWFTDFFLEYMPGYNKFRAVSMTLVIAEFTIPLLGILGLQKIISKEYDPKKINKQILYALGLTAGVVVLLLMALSSPSSFASPNDIKMFGQNDLLIDAIQSDRLSLFRKDALRSLFFILLGASVVWLFIKQKIKQPILLVVIGLGIIVDLWGVDKRFLNNEDFVKESQVKASFKPSVADQSILKDKSPNYRVINLGVSTFNDATTSHFHKSIGGYHGAKMRRYQELITHHIAPELQDFSRTLNDSPTQASVNKALASMDVLNMLNTKYVIYNPSAPAIPNPFSNGNAWFVKDYKIVANADEEIAMLANINPKQTAVIDKRFENQTVDLKADATAKIKFLEYHPNYLKYKSNCKTEQMAVFSEIYYNKGWQAYVDGEKVPHFRADYVLRAMKVPAGEHIIEFKFEPQVYNVGVWVGYISSILLILLFFSGFWYDAIQRKKSQVKSS